MRPELRDRPEPTAVERCSQDSCELGRRARRASLHLQLDTTVFSGKLELPDVLAVLQPPAKLESETQQKPVFGVVVGGRERAWRNRLAAEVSMERLPSASSLSSRSIVVFIVPP